MSNNFLMALRFPTIQEKRNPALLFSAVCTVCGHYDSKNASFKRCEAFPDGIPQEIFSGRNKHTQSYKGDKGIKFREVEFRLKT